MTTPLEEILVIHHSHLDLGYTHGQPIVGRLHVEFIRQALDLLDATASFPPDSAPKWTCEATWPVLDWLEDANDDDLARFRHHYGAGRIEVCALPFGLAPLLGRDLLPELLEPLARLRDRLGVVPRTALQHDVNGVPWPLADVLLDADIEALFMGINPHCGGAPLPRPDVFLWETPTGRTLPVFNGMHYTVFDQFMRVDENDPAAFRAGMDEFLGFLTTIGHRLPFVWATATNSPQAYDNSPPNPELAPLIRQWNESGAGPRIRFATPADLLDRLAAMPPDALEVRRGDWTDHWNFGCGSTAAQTALHKQACEALTLADRLRRESGTASDLKRLRREAVSGILHYAEHTWGADRSVMGDCVHVRSQWLLKQQHAAKAAESAAFLLFDALEEMAGNPPQTRGPVAGALVVNPAPEAYEGPVAIPDAWRENRKRLRCERVGYGPRFADAATAPLFGPVRIEAGASAVFQLADLAPYRPADPVRDGISTEPAWTQRPHTILNEDRCEATGFIESPHHRLEYHAGSGRILAVTDRRTGWNLLADHPSLGFFEYVRESPDARFDDRREAYYSRDIVAERLFRTCWRTDWKSRHETAWRVRGFRVENNGAAATFIQELEAPGVSFLEQRVTLHAHTPRLDLTIELVKPEIRSAEATYFAMPTRLAAGWRGFFDTAGQTVELDREQLAGSARGWVTCDRFAALCDERHGLALFTPDAPLVQFGDFNFGRHRSAIPRPADPLLLAWPLNNYWNTNFAGSQPGRIRLRYALRSFATADLARVPAWAAEACQPLAVHPVVR